MEEQKILNLVIKKSNWIAHIIYWLIAAFLMYFIFGNRDYDQNIRLVLVSSIIIVSYIVTQVINYFLIPKYLFVGKFWTFIYLMFGIFSVNLWLIVYSTVLIVIYSMSYLPNLVVPQKDDIIILVSGNFLIIILAAVIHFIKESYRRFIEKDLIAKQKHQTELKLKEANLKLLQGQIHPHFLFNMLNNLYGLVKENTDTSREVIVKLSHLLDYMLYECDKPYVSLNKEIDFIQNYKELERVRHDDSFNVNIDVSLNGNDYEIAPLILFPFVENSFKHGFHDPEKSFIDIKINIVENKLYFTIENSISNIKKDKYLNTEGKGIGLKNSKERLELIYHNKYHLNIRNDKEVYKVELLIELNT